MNWGWVFLFFNSNLALRYSVPVLIWNVHYLLHSLSVPYLKSCFSISVCCHCVIRQESIFILLLKFLLFTGQLQDWNSDNHSIETDLALFGSLYFLVSYLLFYSWYFEKWIMFHVISNSTWIFLNYSSF